MLPNLTRTFDKIRAHLPAWRDVLGNSAWLLAERALRWSLGLVVGVWTARYLGPTDFGALNSTLAWIALFGASAGLGIEPIILRELVRQPERQMTIIATALALRFGGGAVAAGLSITSSHAWTSSNEQTYLVAIASLITLLGFGDILDIWFQAKLQARQAATARTTAYLIACLVRVVLIKGHAPLTYFVWLAVIETVLSSFALGLLLKPTGAMRFLPISTTVAHDLIKESWPNLISNVAAILYLRIDRILLVSLSGESIVGIYSAAAGLVDVWYSMPLAIVGSATPLLTKLHATDSNAYYSKVTELMRAHAMGAWLLVLILACASFTVVPLLYGPAYAGTGSVMTILAFGLPFAFMGIAAIPWYVNARIPQISMIRHLLGAALNLTLNAVLIPKFGAAGASIATVAAFAFTHVFANGLFVKTRPIFRLQLRALSFFIIPPPSYENHRTPDRQG